MHSWKHIGNTLFTFVVIGTLVAIVYVNRQKYVPVYESLMSFVGIDKACSKPIVFYIEEFNPKFGQTIDEFKNNLQIASSIWNNAYGKEILRYSREDADKMFDLSKRKLQVNLIYDQRQATTQKLQTINSTISSSKDSYENTKASYDALKIQYENKKQLIENMEQNRSKRQEINKEIQELNVMVEKLNSLGKSLNSMNKDINQKISIFNEISLSNGAEFQEGEYVMDEYGQRINIYEYKDQNKLIRVLAHEFGHALGIEHVEGENSIMNAYNNNSNTNLTQNDLNALKAVCEAK